MNEFVSWCRHLLVPFLFHDLTSLLPPSFQRNDFSTCKIQVETEGWGRREEVIHLDGNIKPGTGGSARRAIIASVTIISVERPPLILIRVIVMFLSSNNGCPSSNTVTCTLSSSTANMNLSRSTLTSVTENSNRSVMYSEPFHALIHEL